MFVSTSSVHFICEKCAISSSKRALRLHNRRRRHRRLPAGGDALRLRQGTAPREGRPSVRQPQRHPSRQLHELADGPVVGLCRAVLRLYRRRPQPPRPRAGRELGSQRRVLLARGGRVREAGRVGGAGGGGGVRVGGEEGGVPAEAAGVAEGGEGGAGGRWGVAVQWVYVQAFGGD